MPRSGYKLVVRAARAALCWSQAALEAIASLAFLAMCACKAGTRTLAGLGVSLVIQARRVKVVMGRSQAQSPTVMSLMARCR
jgi:hypothetical protein